MTSQKQIGANRRNAQKSTGPKTPEGKDVVRFNPMRHGLTAQTVLLPDEDPQEYTALLERVLADLNPVGELEIHLSTSIAIYLWRLGRAARIAAGLLTWENYEGLIGRALEKVAQLTGTQELSHLGCEFLVVDKGFRT